MAGGGYLAAISFDQGHPEGLRNIRGEIPLRLRAFLPIFRKISRVSSGERDAESFETSAETVDG
jgi:hypothetical protein